MPCLLLLRAKYYMSIFEPTCVEAQNVDEARQILVHGRQASRNWEAIDNMEARPRLNRCVLTDFLHLKREGGIFTVSGC